MTLYTIRTCTSSNDCPLIQVFCAFSLRSTCFASVSASVSASASASASAGSPYPFIFCISGDSWWHPHCLNQTSCLRCCCSFSLSSFSLSHSSCTTLITIVTFITQILHTLHFLALFQCQTWKVAPVQHPSCLPSFSSLRGVGQLLACKSRPTFMWYRVSTSADRTPTALAWPLSIAKGPTYLIVMHTHAWQSSGWQACTRHVSVIFIRMNGIY